MPRVALIQISQGDREERESNRKSETQKGIKRERERDKNPKRKERIEKGGVQKMGRE